MKLINHLTKKEIKGIPSRNLYGASEINKHIIVLNNGQSFYLITGYVIDLDNYYVLYEITKSQYESKKLIHEILV